MKQQIAEMINFGGYPKGAKGGKVTLSANDYDFLLTFFDMTEQDGKKQFNKSFEVDIKKDELIKVAKVIFEESINLNNRIRFKLKEITQRTQFITSRINLKNSVGLYIAGHYNITPEGYKQRHIVLYAKKYQSWDEVRDFLKNPESIVSSADGVYEFSPLPVGRGAWVNSDMLEIENMHKSMEDCVYKRNISYVEFLNKVFENKKSEDNGYNNGNSNHNKPKEISDNSDDFPF